MDLLRDYKLIDIDSLKEHPQNPRIHKKEDIVLIADNIRKNGWTNPILIDEDNQILAGHARYLAAKHLKLAQVPILRIPLKGNEALAYLVWDNKSTEKSEFDNDKLSELFAKFDNIEQLLTGFDKDEISQILDRLKSAEEDDFDAEASLKNPKYKIERGEIWQCGNHRVMCGDATSKEDAEKLMDGKKADMVFTDPPYGVSYSEKNKFLNAISRGNHIQTPIENDQKTVPEMSELWVNSFKLMNEFSKSGASYYVCSPQGGELMMMMMKSLQDAGWQLKHSVIWVKNNHVLGRSDYHYRHEPILYGWKEGSHSFYGGTGKTSVWMYDKPLKSDLHPTMKPIPLVSEAIKNSSKGEDIIIDFFLGSGTTLIACEQLNRVCFGMEISPEYCSVILERWEKLTGKTAVKMA